jgi:hypothetical protein
VPAPRQLQRQFLEPAEAFIDEIFSCIGVWLGREFASYGTKAVMALESGAGAEDHLLFSLAKCYFIKTAKYGLSSEQVETDSEFV